jgi:hypothetical protein
MITDIFGFYLQNRPIQTSQTGGQWYNDTSHFSIPWLNYVGLPGSTTKNQAEFSTLDVGVLIYANQSHL